MKDEERIESQLALLKEKYKDSGQDMSSYLDGLLHQRYLTYWDYIHLDTLLSLQVPRTHFPDELIFISYHQITELYFKLILHEQRQIVDDKSGNVPFFISKLQRINTYYEVLISSFSILIRGMDREQFLQFRMALLPSSGFQSAQFRMIELYATPLENLVHPSTREQYSEHHSIEDLYEQVYWKKGATDLATGVKTLTLRQFEYRYTPRFIRIAKQVKDNTIYHKYQRLPEKSRNTKALITALKRMDLNANVNWPLMHMGSAQRHLDSENNTIEATGGTNWKEYLPPHFQKIVFFPGLYTNQELKNWGKQWVDHIFNPEKIKN